MPPRTALDRLDRLVAHPAARASVLTMALLGVYLQAHTFFLSESHEVDSYSYWFAARAIATHGNPYDLSALQAEGRRHELRLLRADASPPAIYPYVYPPPFAGLWRVFLPFEPTAVHRGLEVLGTLALGLALVLLDRAVAARRHRALLFALFALTLVVNGPAVSSTRLGQVNAALLAAIAFAVLGHRTGRDAASALALAASTLVKLTPGLVLFSLAAPGERRAGRYAAWFALALAALVLVSLPFAPPVHWAQFADSFRLGLPWRSEYSLWGWLAVHAERWPGLVPWRFPLAVAGSAAAVFCAWRHQQRLAGPERALEGAASAVVLGLLLSPLTWQHHFLFFLLPAWVWLARAWAEERTGLALAFAVLTTLVLLRLPGSLLIVRPAATALAFVLATLGPKGPPRETEPQPLATSASRSAPTDTERTGTPTSRSIHSR